MTNDTPIFKDLGQPKLNATNDDDQTPAGFGTPAQRALREAKERQANKINQPSTITEVDGRGGLDPVRYGDWEVKGLVSDF